MEVPTFWKCIFPPSTMSSTARPLRPLRNFIQEAERRNRRFRKVVEPIAKWSIVKGDTVAVVAGKDRGKTGKARRTAQGCDCYVACVARCGWRVRAAGRGASC